MWKLTLNAIFFILKIIKTILFNNFSTPLRHINLQTYTLKKPIHFAVGFNFVVYTSFYGAHKYHNYEFII